MSAQDVTVVELKAMPSEGGAMPLLAVRMVGLTPDEIACLSEGLQAVVRAKGRWLKKASGERLDAIAGLLRDASEVGQRFEAQHAEAQARGDGGVQRPIKPQ